MALGNLAPQGAIRLSVPPFSVLVTQYSLFVSRGSSIAQPAAMLDVLTMLAVACYAVNGALKALQKEMDFFGAVVIALVTAVGGGTLRDMLLSRPVFWVHDPRYVYVGTAIAALVVVATRLVRAPSRSVVVTDALGLALFAVIGAHVACSTGAPLVTAILTGAMTGFAGGIARDVLCGEVPRVLKRDIHATAAIAGSATYVLLRRAGAGEAANLAAGMAVVLLIRAVESWSGIHLPTLRIPDDAD